MTPPASRPVPRPAVPGGPPATRPCPILGALPVSEELTAHRLRVLEEDRREAALWRMETGKAIGRIEASLGQGFALGSQRMDEMDRHLVATEANVTELQNRSRRDPVTLWTSICAALTAAAVLIAALFHKP